MNGCRTGSCKGSVEQHHCPAPKLELLKLRKNLCLDAGWDVGLIMLVYETNKLKHWILHETEWGSQEAEEGVMSETTFGDMLKKNSVRHMSSAALRCCILEFVFTSS